MKANSINREIADIALSYDEVYTVLQCVANTRDSLDDNDTETIIGTTKSDLRQIAIALNKIKNDMRP